MRGLALSNSDVIREVHNSFSRYFAFINIIYILIILISCLIYIVIIQNKYCRQTIFEYDSKQASKDDDVFHFVSYVSIDGRLYELDGLKDGPMDLGPCPLGDQWVQAAKPIIQKRINK